jgi:hypothetical protein
MYKSSVAIGSMFGLDRETFIVLTADRRTAVDALVCQPTLDGLEWVESLKTESVQCGVLRSARMLNHPEVAG